MGTGRKKKFFSKGMAGALVVSLFFSMMGSHADGLVMRAQAAEGTNDVISFNSGISGAVMSDGSLWMWGENNYGQLGNGTQTDSSLPIKIMEDVKEVSLGSVHSAAIKTDGSLWMWGYNRNGCLGQNKTSTVSVLPIQIMKDVETVSLGSDSTGIIKTDGSLWMWGTNRYGGLGAGDRKLQRQL